MLKGRYKIVFNYVRKQINKGNYKITYNYFGEKLIHFDKVIISSLSWYVIAKNKKYTGYCLTWNCDNDFKYYLNELLKKELNNEQI